MTDYVENTFRFDDASSAKFETSISRSVVIHEAQKEGKTIFETHPTHKVCEQYRELAREIEARLKMPPPALDEAPSEEDVSGEAVANG